MPNQTINIYSGISFANTITLSDGFNKVNYIYLVFEDTSIDVEVDISLQIYLTPTIQRAIRLENDNILNTVSITLIPSELVQSPFNMRLAIITNQDLNINVFAVRTECCGEAQLDRIKSQLNRIEAYNAISGISDVVTAIASGFLAFTVSQVALPLLLPNLARQGFSLLVPSIGNLLGSSAQILFDNVPQLVLQAGQYYIDEVGFTGLVSAQSLTGQAIELGIKEYT